MTKSLVHSRFWWPSVYCDEASHVRSCQGCQFSKPIPHYHSDLFFLSVAFSPSSRLTLADLSLDWTEEAAYILVCVKPLTGWPIAQAMANATINVVISFIRNEIIHSLGVPKTVISENVTCSPATTFSAFMNENGVQWKPVLAHAPMSNSRA